LLDTPIEPCTGFRLCYGPMVKHTGCTWESTTHNRILSLFRLFNCRKGDKRLEEELRDNQEGYVQLSQAPGSYLNAYLNFLSFNLMYFFQDVHDSVDAIRHNALDPTHEKYHLRKNAYNQLYESGQLYGSSFVTSVVAKFKEFEFAKPLKIPRNIIDLTCPGSLFGGWLAKIYKNVMSIPFNYLNLEAHFVQTPDQSVLDLMFSKLLGIGNTAPFVFIFFSDDSCASFETTSGRLFVNLDISSCDISHTHHVFDLFISTLARTCFLSDARCLVQQLTLPISFNYLGKKLKFIPDSPKLYSGSVLTTLINNLANMLICTSIAESYNPRMSRQEVIDMIPLAAARAGYIVTVDVCECPEDLQFLKNSPTITPSGDVCSFLNLGVLLRTLGQGVGLPPGKQTKCIESLCRAQNSNVVQAFKHGGDHCVSRAVSHLVTSTCEPSRLSYLLKSLVGRSHSIDDTALLSRYRLTDDELYELVTDLQESQLHHFISNSAADKILAKDYGY